MNTLNNNNYQKVEEIAGKFLGQKGGEGYKDQYDPNLLVAIPRYLNRQAYSINSESLPFFGTDVWNAYEVSALTRKGLPVSGMLKIIIPADTEYHVESKSLKLYLNSFNMTIMGDSPLKVVENIEKTTKVDLSALLQCERIKVRFIGNNSSVKEETLLGFPDLSELVDLGSIDFNEYTTDKSRLVENGYDKILTLSVPTRKRYKTDLLRSNCRVTNQPDWGDLFIEILGYNLPTPESLAKYVVSHRQVNHFHEEIVEMTFMHLLEAFKPQELLVAALYTRRGGIDINPIRATHENLIPSVFTAAINRLAKTLRQ